MENHETFRIAIFWKETWYLDFSQKRHKCWAGCGDVWCKTGLFHKKEVFWVCNGFTVGSP